MTIITINQVEDFLDSIRPDSMIYADISGYVIRIEERLNGGSHLGKTMRAHPGNDTLEIALKDVLAIVKDKGIQTTKY